MASATDESAASGLVQYLIGLEPHERLEATSIQLPELLEAVRQLQEHCPRCDYVPRVLVALLPHCAAAMPSVSQVVVPPLALLRPLLNTRRVVSLMQFVWGSDTATPPPTQHPGQHQQQQQEHATAQRQPFLSQDLFHPSLTLQPPISRGPLRASAPTAVQSPQAPQDSARAGPQAKSGAASAAPHVIRLSDSVLTDDALLSRFMREGLAHLQAVERGGGGCAWHCVCSGPRELEATEARLVEQRQAALESLEALEAPPRPSRPSTGTVPRLAAGRRRDQHHWHDSDDDGVDDDVGEEASAAAAAAEAAAAQVAHMSLAPAHSDPSAARPASTVPPHHARSLTQPATVRTSSSRLSSVAAAHEGRCGPTNQLARAAELRDRLQQIDQRLKRLSRAQEHGLEAGGHRLLTLLLSRCWGSLVRHALHAQSHPVLSRLIGGPENRDGSPCGAHSEESAAGPAAAAQSLCSLLVPSAEGCEAGLQSGSIAGHLLSLLSSAPFPGLGQTESAKAELRAANERLRLLTRQLEECQAAQTAMGLELTDTVDQADAAQARADEVQGELRASLARWQGDPSALRSLLPEQLQELAAQMEGAASRVRAAQAQAHAERELLCPCCWEQRKDLVFSCGHQCCSPCGERLTACPICRTPIDRSRQIRMFI